MWVGKIEIIYVGYFCCTSKMLSLSLPINYVVMPRAHGRSRTPPEERIVRWSAGVAAITKREKLMKLKAIEEAALPRMRVMMLQDFVDDLRNDIYNYAERICTRRSVEMTIGAMRIVAQNLVKDYPKNKHAGFVLKKLTGLYEMVCIRLFDPLACRFDAADHIVEYIDEANELITSILQWHSVQDSVELDV